MKAKLIALINQMTDDQVEKLLADMDNEGDFCPKSYGIAVGCHPQALLHGECFECWTKLVAAQEVAQEPQATIWTANDTPGMEELKKLGVDGDVIGFEFEEEGPTARSCTTCQHKDSPAKQHPCRFCGDSPTGESIYWEPKTNK